MDAGILPAERGHICTLDFGSLIGEPHACGFYLRDAGLLVHMISPVHSTKSIPRLFPGALWAQTCQWKQPPETTSSAKPSPRTQAWPQDGHRVVGTAIWTDRSRLEDGSVGCVEVRHHPEHDAWTEVRVHMGKGKVYDADLHAIYRGMLTIFQEPRGQKITIFTDTQTALQRITSDIPGPGQRYALAIAQQAHGLREQRRVSVHFFFNSSS